MTQKMLSDQVGILQHDLSRLEKQTSNRVIENWIRLARALNTTVEELYGDFLCEK